MSLATQAIHAVKNLCRLLDELELPNSPKLNRALWRIGHFRGVWQRAATSSGTEGRSPLGGII